MQSHNFSLLEKKKIKTRSLPIIVYVIPYLNDLFAALFFFFKKHKILLHYSNIDSNIDEMHYY